MSFHASFGNLNVFFCYDLQGFFQLVLLKGGNADKETAFSSSYLV